MWVFLGFVLLDLLHILSYLPKSLNFVKHSSYIGWREYELLLMIYGFLKGSSQKPLLFIIEMSHFIRCYVFKNEGFNSLCFANCVKNLLFSCEQRTFLTSFVKHRGYGSILENISANCTAAFR